MDLNLMDFDNLEFTLLPGKNPENNLIDLYNSTFEFWKIFWSQVFKDVESSTIVNPDDFFRQDFILVLHVGNEIVAIHLYSKFNLTSKVLQEHSYFKKNFPPEYFLEIDKININNALSMEYLSVNPKYRRSHSSLLTSHILISLGIKVFLEMTTAEAIVALVRNDNKAFDLCSQFGLQEVNNVKREFCNNRETVFAVALRKNVRMTSDLQAYRIVEKLWQKYSIKKQKEITLKVS